MKRVAALIFILFAGSARGQVIRTDFVAQAPITLILKSGRTRAFYPAADTDAARGTALRTAAAAMTDDSALVIGAGTFDLGVNRIRDTQFPRRCLIDGAGRQNTIIKTQGTSALGVLWEPGDDNTIQDLQFWGSLTNGSAQLLVGNDSDTADAATGVVFRNVWFRADSDCFYCASATLALEAKSYGSIWQSMFDTVYPSGAAHTLEFNSDQIIGDTTGTGSNTGGTLRAVRGATGAITVNGGSISAKLTLGDFLSECYCVLGSGATIKINGVTLTETSTLGDGSALAVFCNSGTVTLDETAINTAITSGATGAGVSAGGGTINFISGRVTTVSGVGNHLSRTSGTLTVGPGVVWSTSSGTITRGASFGVTPGSLFLSLVDDATASAARDTLGASSGVFPASVGGTGISALGSGVATYLGDPSAVNFAAMQTGETGTGAPVLDTSPTFTTTAKFPSGTASVPGIAMSADADGSGTGLYRSATDEISISINGTQKYIFNGTRISASMYGDANGNALSSSFGALRLQQTYLWYGNGDDCRTTRGAAGVLTVEGASSAGGTLAFTKATRTQFTANQDNLALGSTPSYFQRLSSDAARDLTGIAAGIDGEIHLLVNVGSNNIVIKHDVTSTAANRFKNSTGADITLAANQAVDIIYDSTASRWLAFKRN